MFIRLNVNICLCSTVSAVVRISDFARKVRTKSAYNFADKYEQKNFSEKSGGLHDKVYRATNIYRVFQKSRPIFNMKKHA